MKPAPPVTTIRLGSSSELLVNGIAGAPGSQAERFDTTVHRFPVQHPRPPTDAN